MKTWTSERVMEKLREKSIRVGDRNVIGKKALAKIMNNPKFPEEKRSLFEMTIALLDKAQQEYAK